MVGIRYMPVLRNLNNENARGRTRIRNISIITSIVFFIVVLYLLILLFFLPTALSKKVNISSPKNMTLEDLYTYVIDESTPVLISHTKEEKTEFMKDLSASEDEEDEEMVERRPPPLQV